MKRSPIFLLLLGFAVSASRKLVSPAAMDNLVELS